MKKLIITLLLALQSFAAPTIHIGSNMVFEATYRVSQVTEELFTPVYFGTDAFIDASGGLLSWLIEDSPAGVLERGSQTFAGQVLTWLPAEAFVNPLPAGYPTPGNYWLTNQYAIVYHPGQRLQDGFIDTGIRPHMTGDVWVSWKGKRNVSVVWGEKPKGFK